MREFCPLWNRDSGLMFAQVQTSWLNFGDLMSMIPRFPPQPPGKAATCRRRRDRDRTPKVARKLMVDKDFELICFAG
jgi:hypothetical protein